MLRTKIAMNNLAGIQYFGHGGVTQSCIEAITRLISTGEELTKAYLLTNNQSHAFLLENVYEEAIAIKSGFSSGYSGEGPRGLAVALKILDRHEVEIDEYEVSLDILERLDRSCLLSKDIDDVKAQRPVRPRRWYDYIYDHKKIESRQGNSLSNYYPLSLPFALIDARLIDLAVGFNKNSDAAIISAFRRLEDILRRRTGLTGEGTKLFSRVFLAEDCPLCWDVPDDSECKGRANLFIATYMAFRNARVHRESRSSAPEALREFMLVNELYRLEGESLTEAELIEKRKEEKALQEIMRSMQADDLDSF